MLLFHPRADSARFIRVIQARAAGTGVYLHEWHYEAGAPTTDSVLTWVREVMASTRRPWGIANFDLALRSTPLVEQRLSLRGLATHDLYPGEDLEASLGSFLVKSGGASTLAVALFSWGDAIHASIAG